MFDTQRGQDIIKYNANLSASSLGSFKEQSNSSGVRLNPFSLTLAEV
jgi:hypothetical protein